ncbi:MAG: UDP-glucose/GDP-mannose dehydrogenase family protein [Candidatus Hydrogenedentes bacterium]|nr:UDP-glucose/GDP-mannose dehydrogenase family protein [Candidatus Hydrogenedentota bacterium]
MKIAVVGTGHVGLVVGTGLAENGHYVKCMDIDEAKIAMLQAGEMPIYEPGLEELVVRNMEEERLKFTTALDEAVKDVLLIFICVGTPPLPDGGADTSQVFSVVDAIGKAIDGYRIVVNKSTCPVGSTEEIRDRLAESTSQSFDVVVNPEFLRQGSAVDDFMRPDRIVVGCDDVRVEEIMKELYAPFLRTGKPLLLMSIRSAEMAKYAVNAMLATRISFMNEMATLCEAYGADIGEVREGVAADSRIGPAYLFPGIGFGGSCLPKDVVACAKMAEARGLDTHIMKAVSAVNREQQQRFIETILAHYGERIKGKRIAVWGASFKPKTDDLRDGPALHVIDALLEAGAAITVYDPVADRNLAHVYGDRITVVPKNYAALQEADGLVITTEWNEFRRPDYERMGDLMREKVIFDGRNLYTASVLEKAGFRYFSVGRPSV